MLWIRTFGFGTLTVLDGTNTPASSLKNLFYIWVLSIYVCDVMVFSRFLLLLYNFTKWVNKTLKMSKVYSFVFTLMNNLFKSFSVHFLPTTAYSKAYKQKKMVSFWLISRTFRRLVFLPRSREFPKYPVTNAEN